MKPNMINTEWGAFALLAVAGLLLAGCEPAKEAPPSRPGHTCMSTDDYRGRGPRCHP
jgi:hypothetical protein